MPIKVGTSGFAYKEWIGPFYPEGTREKEMLTRYAAELDTVEINNSFYRFPTAKGIAAWAAQVPEHFCLAIKAPQRITHIKRLKEVDEDVDRLIEAISTLGVRLGPLLFQLPPRMPLNLTALSDLVMRFPPGLRAAFEFRDRAWHCPEVNEILAQNGCALCWNDAIATAPHPTTDWGYARLRRERYTQADLAIATKQLKGQPWRDTYVYIKHETPDAPLLARRLATMMAAHP